VWEHAQLRLADGRRIFAPKQRKGQYLMGRRLTCYCGYSIGVNTCTNQQRRVYLYYTCVSGHAADTGNRCKMPNLRAEQVDTAVWEWIVKMYRNPETIYTGFEKGLENAKTFQDRLEVVEALNLNLTGVLFLKDDTVKLRIHWWGGEEPLDIDDQGEPTCSDNGNGTLPPGAERNGSSVCEDNRAVP
jgi:hypothetical protein